jgi:hypothetical protein
MTSKGYGPDTTTDEVLAEIDFSNKVTIVTWASGGILRPPVIREETH